MINDLRIDGLVTFWRLSEQTSRQAMCQGLAALGLEAFQPHGRTPMSALRAALQEVFCLHHYMVRPNLKLDGFVVVCEERRSTTNYYSSVLAVRVQSPEEEEAPARLIYDGFADYENQSKLECEFARQRALLPAASVTRSLVQILQSKSATCLRPSGGLYWLCDRHERDWDQVREVVQRAGPGGGVNSVYKLRHRLDESAIHAVRDAIIGEIQAEGKKLSGEVFSGDLGAKAMKHRAGVLKAMQGKIKLYEALLGETLGFLSRDLEEVETALAGSLVASGAEEEMVAA